MPISNSDVLLGHGWRDLQCRIPRARRSPASRSRNICAACTFDSSSWLPFPVLPVLLLLPCQRTPVSWSWRPHSRRRCCHRGLRRVPRVIFRGPGELVWFCKTDLGSSPRWMCKTGQWRGASGKDICACSLSFLFLKGEQRQRQSRGRGKRAAAVMMQR